MADSMFLGVPGVYDFYPREQRKQIHEWLLAALAEGEDVISRDPAAGQADEMIAYVMGDQRKSPTKLVKEIPEVIVNKVKKAIRDHVSALTDLKPMFAFRAYNPYFNEKAAILTKYATIWWINTFADLELADAIRYALVAGSGDVVVEYDPSYQGGDTRMIVRDPRDTIPIRPTRTRSLQEWEGVTLRESHSPNKLIAKFGPGSASFFRPGTGNFRAPFTQYRQIFKDRAATTGTLSGLGRRDPNKQRNAAVDALPSVTFYRTFLHDRTLNMTSTEQLVGEPGTAWSYMVPPGQPLYPNGRMILWTEYGVVWDGPNPYWHGMFPVARLRLDPWPWLFLGIGILHDMLGTQDTINRVVNDFLQNLSQHVNRGTVWDRNTPASERRRFNPAFPNYKVVKPNNFSDGFKFADVAALPPWAFPFLTTMFTQFDDQAGTANLSQLLQLRQVPGRDTVEKYTEALTGSMRLEGRNVEALLRDVANMVKSNLFQFQSAARRYALLGDAGSVIEDLDYDPETIIPAMSPEDPYYVADLDKDKPQHERARFFSRQFVFTVAPHSMLASQAQERKLLMLQLARQGYVDLWTLGEALDIPNMGTPPAVQLPPRQIPEQASNLPPNAEVVEWRIPETVTERLIAQRKLQIGQQVSPAGRKASGQEMPFIEQRKDGSTTVTESR